MAVMHSQNSKILLKPIPKLFEFPNIVVADSASDAANPFKINGTSLRCNSAWQFGAAEPLNLADANKTIEVGISFTNHLTSGGDSIDRIIANWYGSGLFFTMQYSCQYDSWHKVNLVYNDVNGTEHSITNVQLANSADQIVKVRYDLVNKNIEIYSVNTKVGETSYTVNPQIPNNWRFAPGASNTSLNSKTLPSWISFDMSNTYIALDDTVVWGFKAR